MAELKIDTDRINDKVIPQLNKAKTELESAANSLSNISYSPDYYKFTNRSRVQSVLPQNIRNIKADVNNISTWLKDVTTKFQDADRNSNSTINSLLIKMDKMKFSGNMSQIEENKKTTENKNEYNIIESLIEQGKEMIGSIGTQIDLLIKKLLGFIGEVSSTRTESIYQSVCQEDLELTACEVTYESESENGNKLKDDPEIKEGLEQLNALLELQKSILEENATEILDKLTQNYNPEIKHFGENYFEGRDVKNPADVEEGIVYLERQLDILKSYFSGNDTILDEYYDFNITKQTESLCREMGWEEEEWKSIQEYMKKNNLTWRDIISEYENAISELTAYNEQLIENKSAIYSLERYIDLYPYTTITLKDDFEQYLNRDYSNETIDKPNVWESILSAITFGSYKSQSLEDFGALTQEEKAIYFYLKEKYSESEAKEYYKSLEDIINQRKGMKDALEYVKNLDLTGIETVDGLNNFLMTTGMGLTDGVWSFGEGLSNLFPGNGEIMSELQYKQVFLTSMLTQEINLDEIAKNYGKDSEEYKLYEKLYKMQDAYRKALGVNYNVASTIGSEAIPIAVSLIPEVGQTLGIALSSLSDAGNAKATAYQSGVTGWNAYLYAGIRGVTSAVITKSFGAIPGLSDNASTTLKGIIKGSVQSGLSAVAQQKIDLFTLKVLSGESINLEEFFDIEQDAMTFVTAVCTALILNGGKALKIKLDGEEATISTEDIEKCTNEDGSLDTNKVLELLKGKLIPAKDNRSVQIKLTEAKQYINEFISTKKLSKYITQDEIDNLLNNKVVICTVEGFKKECERRNASSSVLGFYSSSEDKIYLPEDCNVKTFVHECIHALGSVKSEENKRAINEAFTDYFANQATGTYVNNAYIYNVDKLGDIINVLEIAGDKGLAEKAYFNRNITDFKKKVDQYTYKGFYEELAGQMQIVTYGKTKTEIQNAQIQVEFLTAYFRNSVLNPYYKQIDSAIASINQKYKGQGLSQLQAYVNTGESNRITRNGNARSTIENIPIGVLKEYLKTY